MTVKLIVDSVFSAELLGALERKYSLYVSAPLLLVVPFRMYPCTRFERQHISPVIKTYVRSFPFRSGKKRLFPRFHFTSEADLLDILSNGNQPSKILRHIDKLMLSTSTLVLESVPGNVSDRPRAVRFEAGVGEETIDFEPAVFLEGKVN